MQNVVSRRSGRSGDLVETLEGRRLLSSSPVAAAALVVPVLNSRPQSPHQLYLDFDGEPAFTWLGHSVPATPAYDRDGNRAAFSADELSRIGLIWQAVADKYVSFDLNVTTVRPAAFEDNVAAHMIVGGHGEWFGTDANGHYYNGVATSIGAFYNPSAVNVAFAFSENAASDALDAGVIAHEAGHLFGLQHRATYDANGNLTAEYGDAPFDKANTAYIMGNVASGRRPVWATGPRSNYYGSTQDDLVVLGQTLGTVADPEGGSAATAVALPHSGRTLSAGGFAHALQTVADADWYSFDTAGGTVDLTITAPQGGSLDMNVELRDASGKTVAAVTGFEPKYVDRTEKRLFAPALAAGKYFLVITSAGGYGNIGQYAISGSEGVPTRELSLGRTYSASSSEPSLPPANAGDHNPDTRWASKYLNAPPQWLQVDTGQASTVSEIDLTWAGGYATGYKLQVSADGKNWKDVYATTNGSGGEERITGLNATGRYVRMLSSAHSNPGLIELIDFAVYGTPGTTPPPTPAGTDLARAGVAAASSSDNSARSAAAAIDGNATTRWASQSGDNQWIQVDLKSTAAVTGVRLNWEAAYAKAYKIQFSTDGKTWTDKLVVNSGDGGVDELAVSGTARYVRMQGVTRATKYGYSLFDFNVYGTPTPTPPPASTAGLGGTAFNDANKNGKDDSGDSVAAGKTIWLDVDDDGVKDANEPSVVTDAKGDFTFKDLAAGTYHVRRVFPSGYLESTPARYVTLTAGQTAGGVLIGSKTK